MNTTILRITTIFLPSYLQRSFDQASINNFGTKIKKCSSANSRGSFEGKGNPDSEGVRDFIIGQLQFRPFVAFNRPLLRRHRIGSRRRRPSATVQNCMHEKMHSFAEIGSAKNRKVSRRPSQAVDHVASTLPSTRCMRMKRTSDSCDQGLIL